MASLIYSPIASLDGYVADENGNFDWAEPDEDVHAFINELERSIDTYLLGRRMYEVMSSWETLPLAGRPPVIRDFAQIWRAASKVVFSKTLATVSTARTRIEREFDAAAIRQLKAASESELSVGGAELAASAFELGLVDEVRLFLAPSIVGGGTRALPERVRLELELLDERRFGSGFVYLRYRAAA